MSLELLPLDERKRRLEKYMAAVTRERRWPRVVFWLGFSVGIGLTVAAIFAGWPSWTLVVFPMAPVVPGTALYWVTGRRSRAALVELDIRCPHCKEPLHDPAIGSFAAFDETRTVASGFCPRCFGPLPTLQDLPEEVLEKLPQDARDQLGV
jgi:hypothetical protein